jgi:hypothetical protein
MTHPMLIFLKRGIMLTDGLWVLLPFGVHAASVEMMTDVPNRNDLDLGPTSFPIEMTVGQTVTRSLQLTNRTGELADFFVEVEDFEGSQDPNQSVALQGNKSGKYSAKDWVKPELNKFTLEHGQREHFDVTITAPEDADPGDHYVSVLVRTAPKAGGIENMPNVRLVSRVGSLFFIRIKGPVVEEGELTAFQTNKKVYTQAPIPMGISFKNTGTVRLTPSGIITIKNIFGRTVAVEDIDSFNALRNAVRFFSKEWTPSRWGIGKYTATLELDRGYGGQKDVQSLSFWYLPIKEILIILGGSIGVILIVITLKKNVHIEVGRKK